MANTNAAPSATPPAPRKRRRWLRILGWVFGIFIVLLVVTYFVVTSSAFFKGVILPKVSASLGANITVSDASISPFSHVVLRNLKVETTGPEPLATVPEVRLRYSLMDIIRGNMHVDEVAVVSPRIFLVENPDGTSNLDPILKAMAQKPQAPKPPQPEKPSKPMQVEVVKVALTDASFRQVKLYAGGKQDLTQVSNINVTLDNIKNGQPGKLTIGADVNINKNPPATDQAGVLVAKIAGSFNLTPTADLKGASVQGSTHLDVSRADGSMAQARDFGGSFDCDITPTEIKQLALRLQRGNEKLGEVLVSGPLDMAKSEGHLSVVLRGVDKRLLNMAGAGSGLDFGPTTISSTNDIVLTKGGKMVTAAGQLDVSKLQVTRASQTTPTLDFRTEYSVAVDSAAQTALLQKLVLSGAQGGNQFLKGDLTSPMTIAWGATANAVGDSTLNIGITGFDLAAWKPFLGDTVSSGVLKAQLKLLSQQAGKMLTYDLTSQLANLTAGAGSNRISQADITFALNGTAANLSQFKLASYKADISRQNQSVLTASGSGTFDKNTQNADIQFGAQVMLARLAQAVSLPGMSISSGTVKVDTHVVQTAQTTGGASPKTNVTDQVTGTFALADFSGQIGNNNLQGFGTTADLGVTKTPDQIQIQKLSGRLTQGANAGGTFDCTGTVNTTTKAAQLNLKLMNFNQNGIGPFLQAMLADKKLVSVAVNANAAVQYDPAAASTVKADLQVTNLVVNDPTGQVPATPLEIKLQADCSRSSQNVVDIRQVQLGLTPTARAANQLQLSGRVDMSDTNAVQGNLKLVADALDLTTYYDLFGGQKKAAPAGAPRSTTSSGAPTTMVAKGPATLKLPVRNFVADLNLHKVYLHEVEITDWQTTTKVDGGHIQITPCKLSLNGAPVSASVDADLGVPGFKYNVNFDAQSVAFAPLVNSFQPANKGVLSGTFTAHAKIDGTGTTGADLQKSLSGQFNFTSTNLNLAIANVHNKYLQPVLTAVTEIPDLVKNPLGAGASLLGGVTGVTSTGGNDLSKSPIQSIIAQGDMGSGKVNLQQVVIQSPAFQVLANGTITLAPELTNSTLQIPVTVALLRSVAQSLYLAGPDTPASVTYVQIPAFLSEGGTVGVPKTEKHPEALLKLAAQIAAARLGNNSAAGQAIQGIFGGNKPAGSTNAPSQPGLGGLIQNVPGILGGNKPAGTTNSATPPSGGVGGLIRGFGGVLGGPATNPPPPPRSGTTTNRPSGNNPLNGLFPR